MILRKISTIPTPNVQKNVQIDVNSPPKVLHEGVLVKTILFFTCKNMDSR